MNSDDRPTTLSTRPADHDRLQHAVELALQAPSVHNTQPWCWRIGADRVELFADRNRQLTGTDPDGRDMLISCGAALHHLQVALAGLGVATETDRLPDPESRDHLATVRTRSGAPNRADAALFGQLGRRHTDRRPYAQEPVSTAALRAMVDRASGFGTVLQAVTDPAAAARLHVVLAEAATSQPHRPGYLSELLTWTHRYANAHDGIPATSVPPRDAYTASYLRRFPSGQQAADPAFGPDGGLLLVLATARDDVPSAVQAGEAMSAVLLTATRSGLATAPLSQALEISATRERIQMEALRIPEYPQLIIRVGHPPADSAPLEATPRRPLRSVLHR
ncbi:Acg family FMN-binding oxidoreductase [Pseudonocardia sp. T1-2H]|uniref:Acg family FMN-binding oxidoreductase n=1 Tax=Pseudonocardia sp. T1-2H TaxID=3128899 RepID=UPI0031018115